MRQAVSRSILPLLLAAQAAAAGAEDGPWRAGRVFRDCPDCPEMVVVPAGSFLMGATEAEGGKSEEAPPRRVAIGKPFAIGKYEITWDEWAACVQAKACRDGKDEGFGRGRRPVIDVSRDDAMDYARWLSGKTGQQYRLPSEAEWEYAARAGSTGARHWGDSDEATCQYASVFNARFMPYDGKNWYWEHFLCDDGYKETSPVGTFKPNPFGLHDMLGNVREWTLDCFNTDYAGAPADGSAWQAGECRYYVTRGGSWVTEPAYVRSSARYWIEPTNRNDDLGFRLVRTLP